MITLEEFSAIFNDRHDFEYDDIEFLPSKYPNIKFRNIPEAWVVLVETFLLEIENQERVTSIYQELGHVLILTSEKLNEHDVSVLKVFENHIILLDKDIHDELKEGIILN